MARPSRSAWMPDGSTAHTHPNTEATVYYVAKTGDSTNDGLSLETAFDDPQDAFDAVPAGGEVEIWPGIYQTTVGFTMDTEHVRITGKGGISHEESGPYKGTHLQGNNTGINILEVNVGGGLTQHGIIIENINFSWATVGDDCLVIHAANRWTLRNCTFRFGAVGLHLTFDTDNAWGLVEQCTFRALTRGIFAEDSLGFVVVGGDFQNCGLYSIDIDEGCQHVRLLGTKMDNVGMRNAGEHTKLIGVTFETQDSPMLDIDHVASRSGDDTSLVGCTFVGSGTNVAINIDTDAEGTSITGTTYINVGIEVIDSGTDTVILAASPTPTLQLGPASILTGTGTPEAAVVAPKGSLFLRSDGGAGTTLYVKEATDPAFAAGTLTMDVQPTDTNTLTLGSKTYTFQTTLTNSDGNIAIGGSLAQAQANLVAAIQLSGTAGTDYATAMTRHTTVDMAAFSSDAAVVTALTAGAAGNSIVSTETFTAGTNVFDATTLGTTTSGVGEAGWAGV